LSSGPPDRFPARLGPFHNQCVSRAGTAREIISAASAQELRALLDYANRFHHDTNGAYATELINNAELTSFTGRTLAFIRRPWLLVTKRNPSGYACWKSVRTGFTVEI
jgi:hypothetical protein